MRKFLSRGIRFFSFFILSFFLFQTAFAQTGKIAGKIVDKETGEEMIGVNIVATIAADTIKVITDLQGNYTINIKPGVYAIAVQYLGYNTINHKKVKVKKGKTKNLGMRMQTSNGQIEEVIVHGTLEQNATSSFFIQQGNATTNAPDNFRKLPD